MKYLIGTGYHSDTKKRRYETTAGIPPQDFFPIWWENTMRFAKPERVIVLASGDGPRPKEMKGQWIDLPGDLGHVHDLNQHRKPYHWCTWSIAFCTLALLAYHNECDYVFKEQDVLAFGPWPERMYAEIGEAGMIFGKARCMPAVQSLVLCKHAFIPEFVRLFLGTGSEQIKDNEGELKFVRLEKQNPGKFARYGFPFDRDRPLRYDLPVWYSQHWEHDEIKCLKALKFII